MILSNRKTRRSARVLREALEQINYKGAINWGCSTLNYNHTNILNKPESVANAVNKELALQLVQDAGVPTPLISECDAHRIVRDGFKAVGRTMYHSKGKGMFMCFSEAGIFRAKRLGATHFLKYIEDAREFRVHVVGDKSIKISEKVFVGPKHYRRNFNWGVTFIYPHDFDHKKTLRRLAKEAIKALGLDFGAIDMLYKDGEFYFLECNTAPSLTNENSDTLDCYVAAFTTL